MVWEVLLFSETEILTFLQIFLLHISAKNTYLKQCVILQISSLREVILFLKYIVFGLENFWFH